MTKDVSARKQICCILLAETVLCLKESYFSYLLWNHVSYILVDSLYFCFLVSYRSCVTSYVFCGYGASYKVISFQESKFNGVGCIALIYHRTNLIWLEYMSSGITTRQFEDFRIVTWSIIHTLGLTFLIFKGTLPLSCKI